MPTDIVADTDLDAALAEFQGQLNMIFTRARSMWKESAARIHPDLQPAGYKLLSYIARSGTASAHHLAECFEMDKSVVSRQTRMLEEAGLIVSRPDESDGRLRVLSATPAAQEALAEVRGAHAERMRGAIGELTPDEIRVASKVFRLLSES